MENSTIIGTIGENEFLEVIAQNGGDPNSIINIDYQDDNSWIVEYDDNDGMIVGTVIRAKLIPEGNVFLISLLATDFFQIEL